MINQQDLIKSAEIITEAIPYISRYSGQTVVIKYGGNAMNDPATLKTILQDVATLKVVGVNPVLVHGGGPEITKMLAAAKIPNEFKNGLRVTSKEAMAVVCDALDHINKDIVGKLNALGVKAVGLNGKDAKLIEVVKMKDKTKTDYGFVGDINLINPQILETLIPNYVPVIATIGVDKNGESYNINADIAASAIGGALKAAKLVYLTDVDGVRMDEKKPETLISEICLKEVDKMIEDKKISGGMLPKVLSCVNAIKGGIGNVSIINGTISHSILLELFTAKGIGTMFTR